MRGNVVEALLGAVVLAVAAFFLVFAYSTTEVSTAGGHEFLAKFDRVDGLNVGSDVRLGGIKVGTVTDQRIERETYLAVVKFSVDQTIPLPADSSAAIISDGLLGSKYLSLDPGGDPEKLKPGGIVKFTQSPVSLENLIGQLIFSGQGDKDKDKKDGQKK